MVEGRSRDESARDGSVGIPEASRRRYIRGTGVVTKEWEREGMRVPPVEFRIRDPTGLVDQAAVHWLGLVLLWSSSVGLLGMLLGKLCNMQHKGKGGGGGREGGSLVHTSPRAH